MIIMPIKATLLDFTAHSGRISIPGQFTGAVTVESAKLLDDTWLLRVRDRQGKLHDAYRNFEIS